MAYTLTFNAESKGWPSFYSFVPEKMIGMNNYFYTFKGGNLYRHNTNDTHNNFYGQQYISTLKSVFNDGPLENKLFKAINLEGDATWDMQLSSDIQTTGFIDASYFEKKEGTFYAFVRNLGELPADADEYVLRSVNGIGSAVSVDIFSELGAQYNFSLSPLVDIGSIVSVGDYVYFIEQGGYQLKLGGVITAINRQVNLGVNYILVDATDSGETPTTQTPFVMYIKNAVAESHGILGHYCVFEMQNNSTGKVELFTVDAEVMKSFP